MRPEQPYIRQTRKLDLQLKFALLLCKARAAYHKAFQVCMAAQVQPRCQPHLTHQHAVMHICPLHALLAILLKT